MQGADDNKYCQFLEWDSRLFGRRIGRLKVNELSSELMLEVEQWCHEHQIECLYFLANPNHTLTSSLAAAHNFQLVDVRITLEAKLPTGYTTPTDLETNHIRPARPEDLSALQMMARRLHHDSRFFFDTRFNKGLSERMFEIWMGKCFADETGCVLVAELQGKLAGYVTCHQAASNRGQIQLFGVDEQSQGRGLGSKLMAAARQWFSAEQIQWVSVVTQGRNCRAQRLYQRAGFVTQLMELWYHRWSAPAETFKRHE